MSDLSESRARRIGYPVRTLLAVVMVVVLALAEVVPVVAAHPRHPLPWVAVAAAAAGLVWGITACRRRPSFLLPRLYLLVAVPGWLLFSITDDMTSLWLGVPWLLIVPVMLSGGWVDRLLGTPDPDPSPPPLPRARR